MVAVPAKPGEKHADLAGAAEVEAADWQELLAGVEQSHPDVVLTDLAMPGLSGIAATRQLLAQHPGLGVLVVTMHGSERELRTRLAGSCGPVACMPVPLGATSGPTR